ncbi:ABC transporter substrate-binding protein [Actinomadura citrea]|uniref:Peptide/nickel transport system substrate-binding protein n=1 Tax=Actinomadura citrea TaxID=46158 RepID=A0A7Y9G559_9ACTN|nr:ABC transporter substrate-binding protein [Actinomadura citrea]NYE10061.1 peptide/nickel transport system substrate-binding protein [Actinomadura citrea]GGT69703.1 peptide ABC transporter substrate-binding protein [Actinomadura citrea]
MLHTTVTAGEPSRTRWFPGPLRTRGRAGLRLTAVLAAGALAAAACGGSAGGTSARTQTLIIAENEPPATFDPVQADNSTVDEVARPAYDTLVRYDANNKIVPSVATEWKVSGDGRSIDVTLRGDVTFHDGAKLTAADVRYSLDRIKKLKVGVASLLTPYESTTVADDTHLTIKLARPYAPMIPALTRVYVLNAKLVGAHEGDDQGQKWLATADAGSGPYRLTGYTANQEAKYTQYAKYWGGFSGQAKNVVFRYLPQAATQKSSLLAGDIDIAMDIDPNDWKSFEGNGGYKVDKADTNVQLYVFFKMKDSPVSSRPLREAIASAYQYDQHIGSILKGAGKKAVGVLPSTMACFDSSAPQPAYDVAKAQAALKSAGLSGASLTMTYLKATAEMEQAATLLQSDLAKVGIKLKLEAITYPEHVERLKSNKTTPDLAMIYAFPPNPDPDSVLYQLFDSKFINNGQNTGGYDNPKVDSLVEKAQALTDENERCGLYKQAQQLIAADVPSVNMSNPQTVTVLRKGVEGYAYQASHHQTVDVYGVKVG